jgi:dethiobiotin synthetase
MPTPCPPGLFITGTNTNVGKTHVAVRMIESLVRQGVRVGVYKPAASGWHANEFEQSDPYRLWQAAGRPGTLAQVCPQTFSAPLAPPAAAAAEGRKVDPDLLRSGIEFWQQNSDFVIVEGVGGLMSPVSDDDYVADLAYEFGYKLIVVAANELGVINQTLQTLITAETFRQGIHVAGIVLNHPRNTNPQTDPSSLLNRADLERRCVPPILTELAWNASDFSVAVDWRKTGAL